MGALMETYFHVGRAVYRRGRTRDVRVYTAPTQAAAALTAMRLNKTQGGRLGDWRLR